jgi:hypothetical protein
VIVTSPEQTSLHSDPNLDRMRRSQAELSQVEHGLLFVRSRQAHKVVENFRYSKRSERSVLLRLHQLLDLLGGRFVLEEGEDGKGVKDDHFRRSRTASSILD